MEKNKVKNSGDVKRLSIHIAVISVLLLLGVVASHFALVIFTRHNARCVVPEFKGLILNEAESVAADMELDIVINDSLYAPMYEGGMVLDQLPKAGVEVKPGRTIYVTINAFGDKKVVIPYVAGRSLRQAKNMLEVAGLQIEKLVYKHDMATNYVLSEYYQDTKIEEGSTLEAVVGSGITLYVGMSQKEWNTKMPQLLGMTLREAKSRLWELGLNVGKINMEEDITDMTKDRARVYSQGITRGVDVTLGTNISLRLTLDNERVDTMLEEIAKAERAVEKERSKMEDSLARERIRRLAEQKQSRESREQREQRAQTVQSVPQEPSQPQPRVEPKAEQSESFDSFFE